MNTLVFDIETIPDVTRGRDLLNLSSSELSGSEVGEALLAQRRSETGHEFLPHYLHQVVAISVLLFSEDQLKVWSLGEEDATESELIERFFSGLAQLTPTLVSWNGSGFDLPVLHYRALLHGISAPRYWDTGEEDSNFKWNNYLNRYHTRHLDVMDVLAGYQPRANAPLESIATMLGFPGKMGDSGAKVWAQYQEGDIQGIRNYCETDVLNTFLVYCRFELMRGRINRAGYEHICQQLRTYLKETKAPHLLHFLDRWKPHPHGTC